MLLGLLLHKCQEKVLVTASTSICQRNRKNRNNVSLRVLSKRVLFKKQPKEKPCGAPQAEEGLLVGPTSTFSESARLRRVLQNGHHLPQGTPGGARQFNRKVLDSQALKGKKALEKRKNVKNHQRSQSLGLRNPELESFYQPSFKKKLQPHTPASTPQSSLGETQHLRAQGLQRQLVFHRNAVHAVEALAARAWRAPSKDS